MSPAAEPPPSREGAYATVEPAAASQGGAVCRYEERFVVLALHAHGGLGEVWMAEDVALRRQVALKEIRPQHADLPASRARFVQEAEITGRLEHPGIVPVYALGQRPDGRPFYVMRFIHGESLQTAIDRHHAASRGEASASGALSQRQLLARFVAVCEAVAYAHSRGVLHRDLKPDNVMLGPYGETLVVDWGLAKAGGAGGGGAAAANKGAEGDAVAAGPTATWPAEPALDVSESLPTQLGSTLGTPGYMSPEQARGDVAAIGPAADVYSLGATLYCVLCGRPPIVEPSAIQTLESTAAGRFVAPRARDARVPRPLNSICLRALALEPTERYPTAKELAADVQRYLDDEPVRAHRETWAERATRWTRRHKSAVIAAGAALALTAIVATVAAALIAESRNAAWQLAQEKAELATAEQTARHSAEAERQAAEQARDVAEQQRQRAQRFYALAIQSVDDYLSTVTEEPRLKAADLEALRHDLLVKARDFYELVAAEAEEGEDPHHRRRADAYRRLGQISYEVGASAEAVAAFQRAAEQVMAEGPAEVDAAAYVAIHSDLALAYQQAGELAAAAKVWRVLDEACGRLLGLEPDNVAYHGLQATARLQLAEQAAGSDPAGALALTRLAEQSVAAALARSPQAAALRDLAARIHRQRAEVLVSEERWAAADDELRSAARIWGELRSAAEGWEAEQWDDALAQCAAVQAVVAGGRGDAAGAAAKWNDALEIRQRLAAAHPQAVRRQARLAEVQRQASQRLREAGDYEGAERHAYDAAELYGSLRRAHPESPAYAWGLACARLEQAATACYRGDHDVATEHAAEAERLAASLTTLGSSQPEFALAEALAAYYHGLALIDAGEPARAARNLERAVEAFGGALADRPGDVAHRLLLADAHHKLALLYGPALLDRAAAAAAAEEAVLLQMDQLLAPAAAVRPSPAQARQAFGLRAAAQTGRGELVAAEADWAQAKRLAQGGLSPDELLECAGTAWQAGRVSAALESVRDAVAASPHGAFAYGAARRLALAAAQPAATLDDEQRVAAQEKFQAAAVDMLQIAADRGYFTSLAALRCLDRDPYASSLRARADYRALRASLEEQRE